MSERPDSDQTGDRWDELHRLGEADPRLLELVVRARDALDELGAYLAEKAHDAGTDLPDDVRRYINRPERPQG